MYERSFGTDWEDLSIEETTERAYALGVATELGSPDDDEYERLLAETGTSYEQSIVELAFEEGKRKAAGEREEVADATSVWESLVEDGPKTTVAEEDIPTGDRDGLPAALDSLELLDLRDTDDLETVRLPDFLRK